MEETDSIKQKVQKGLFISICIPAYNCREFIKKTLISLTEQTYKNLEIIIVNDGSTDDTESKINEVIDSRVTVINTENGGAAKARNLAYKQSKGTYIVFFDADDFIDQNYFESQIQMLKADTESIVAARWSRIYNDDLATLNLINNPANQTMTLESWVEMFWYRVNPMTNPGRFLIPRDIIQRAGLWNEDLCLNDDLEFFTRVFNQSKSIIFNNAGTLYYRSGRNSLSGFKGEKAYLSLFNSIKLSTEIALGKYSSVRVKKACANMWLSFIYEVYPKEKKLIDLAYNEIKSIIEPDFKYPAGGYTKFLVNLIGWKLTVHLKNAIKLK